MRQKKGKHETRSKKLLIICLLCAIVLTVSTYAWFIGMKTISVNTFEVSIASADSLELSLDGITFTDELTVSESIIAVLADSNSNLRNNNTEYVYDGTYSSENGNKNSWTKLSPVSSVGKINTTTSKMIMYEKGSLTASKGGYRIMAAELDANKSTESKGYVVFDLFIKNKSGSEYYVEYGDNEEAIYLAYDSAVTAGDTKSYGIENSVRVAFAQIGRTKSDADSSVIQGIACSDKNTGVTSLCEHKDATIWEPNDTKHDKTAITWVSKSCDIRNSDGTWDSDADSCTIEDGEFYQTYAVSGEIGASAKVDVYDGLNTYTGSISETAQKDKLVGVDTFTDTEKNEIEENRIEFMSLAPNSITKVKVYIWIEGQDIDNYDFASLGTQIYVNFGFTKERFSQEYILGEDSGNA